METQASEAQRRNLRLRQIGMVFQEFCLLDYLSARDNVLLPLLLIGLGVLAPAFGSSRSGKNSWQFIRNIGVFAMALLLLYGFEKPVL